MINNKLFGMIGTTLKIIFDFSRVLPEELLKSAPLLNRLKIPVSKSEIQLILDDSRN
jgi:hypothetical protein